MKHKILLTILSLISMMMVASACIIGTANNDNGNDQSDDVQLAFDRGTIVSINDSGDRWLVTQYDENDDGMGRVGAISLRVNEQTVLENADGKTLYANDFYVGQQVKVWTTGPIAESFPEQASAAKFELLPPELTTTNISKAKAVQLALQSDPSAVTYAVKQVTLNEPTDEWRVELVDIMHRERVSTFYVAVDSGDVVREAVAENEVFRIFTPEPQDEAPQHFVVTGEARVFEASFQWMLEDGHNILASGTATAEQSAPEWGHFEFEVNYDKASNPTLILVLHVNSAKDGEIEHQLIMPLKTPEALIERHS